MPLLGKKVFFLAKPLTNVNPDDQIHEIKSTGERFRSKDEYDKRVQLYSEKIWTCQCTGQMNLTYEEAMRSEQQSYKCLRDEFPICFEKAVLELVHHSTLSLDQLVEEAFKKLTEELIIGELVQFKVKSAGQAIQGKIVKLLPQNAEGNEQCTSPSSDKENATEGVKVDDNPSISKSASQLPFKYNVQLLDQEKIIASVPADDLGRLSPTPTKEMLKLFINSHALRFGTHTSSPWVVEDKLIKRHNLPNKFAEFFVSPHKMAEVSKTLDIKKRKSSTKMSGNESKKSKIDQNHLKPIVRVAYMPETDHKYVKKIVSTPVKKIIPSGKMKIHSKIHSVVKNKKNSNHLSSPNKSSKDSSIPKKKKHTENSKKDHVDPSLKKKKKKPKSNESSPTKSKTGDGTKKHKNDSQKAKIKKDVSGTKTSKSKEDTKNKMKKSLPKKDDKKLLKKKMLDGKNGTKKSSTPKKKALKQMTLHDMSGKKSKSPNKIKTLTPYQQQPLVVHRIQKAIDENRKPAIIQLIARAARELSAQQRNALPPHIKQAVLLRMDKTVLKNKLKLMNPEERIAFLKDKRNERLKKLMDDRKVKLAEKRDMRKELKKRYEDKDLASKALPPPKLVFTPEGVPNESFGNVAMITEFLSCYSELLTPGDNQPITTEALMKNLAAGKEGFLYLNRILVILLQTLLQDQIAEDYKEIKVPLSDVPVNLCTASELMRLCLRKHDTTDNESVSSSDSSIPEEIEDVPESLVALLETSEFYELDPCQKLELLVGLCHRILSTYSVQDYMEERQQEASKLWKLKMAELKEKNDLKRAEKAKRLEAKKIQETEVKNEVPEVKKEESQDSKTEQNDKVGLTVPHFYGKNEVTVKEIKTEVEVPNENDSDLASIVKRRRILTAKAQAEREKLDKLEKERREKELEEFRKVKQKELFQKQFEDGLLAARLSLRHAPIGSDRNHNHYWLFSHSTPGLYIEKGWAVKDIEYKVVMPISLQKSTRDIESKSSIASSSSSDEDSDEDNFAKLNTGITKNNKTSIETSIPACGQNLWFVYDTVKELDDLISNLAIQGVRESALKVVLQKHYQDICKAINAPAKVSSTEVLNGEAELLKNFKNELMETETRLNKGGLGGVPHFDKWERKMNATIELRELGKCMLETQKGVSTRFLQGIMAPKKIKIKVESTEDNEDVKETEDEISSEALGKWIEAVETAPTFSRLHVLLGMLDASIKWEKSAENAKCKICRKKGDDTKLLLCDDCNQAFHLYCLRPALTSIPKGDWLCPACQPASAKRTSRTKSYKERHTSSEEEEEESDGEEVENELECSRCGGDEGLINCCRCPAAYHKDCHVPPLRNTPRSWWKCRDCIAGKASKAAKRLRTKLRNNKKLSSGREVNKTQPKKCCDNESDAISEPRPIRASRQQNIVNEDVRTSSRRQSSEINSSSQINTSRKRLASPEQGAVELKKQSSDTKTEAIEPIPKKQALTTSQTKHVQINPTVDDTSNKVFISIVKSDNSDEKTVELTLTKSVKSTSEKTLRSTLAKPVKSPDTKTIKLATSKIVKPKSAKTIKSKTVQPDSPKKTKRSAAKLIQLASYEETIESVASLKFVPKNVQLTSVSPFPSNSPAKHFQSNSTAKTYLNSPVKQSASSVKIVPSTSYSKIIQAVSASKTVPSAGNFQSTSPGKIIQSISFTKTVTPASTKTTQSPSPSESPKKMTSSVYLIKVGPSNSQTQIGPSFSPTKAGESPIFPAKIISYVSPTKIIPLSPSKGIQSPLTKSVYSSNKTIEPLSVAKIVSSVNSSALTGDSNKIVSHISSKKLDNLISANKPGPSLSTKKTNILRPVDKVVPLASSSNFIQRPRSENPINSAEDNKICEEILQKIMRSRFSWPFRVPVDKKQYPDYLDYIEQPLDFQLIKNKCLCTEYNSAADFIEDMHLVLNNARRYPKFQTHSEIQECISKVEEQLNDLLSKNIPNYNPANNSWDNHAYSNIQSKQ